MRHTSRPTLRGRALAAAAASVLLLSACAGDGDEAATPAAADGGGGSLTVVATTSILGDITENLLGDQGEVTVLMGPGVDPHGYSPSARDGALLREADLVVANGLQLEENLISTLEAAEEDGVDIFEVTSSIDPIDFDFDGGDHGHSHGDDDHGDDDDHGGDDHGHGDHGDDHGHGDDGHGDDHGRGDDDHGDDGHGHDDDHADGDDEHGHDDDHGDDGHGHDDDHADGDDDHGHDDDHGDDDHGHAHGPEDPHVWFDPVRMADAIADLSDALIAAGDIDADAIGTNTEAYLAELDEVHTELEQAFAAAPDEDRVAVTNHDALGYLAARYDFQVVGTVIPGASTQAETSAQDLAELIATVEELGISTVFAENTESTVLAEQLANEAGRDDLDIEVVRIATDALDEPGNDADSYLGLLRSTGTALAASFGS